MKTIPSRHFTSRFNKLATYLIAFLTIFTVIVVFVVPPVVKHILVTKLSEQLRREVSIGQIQINPYSLSLYIKGFTIKDIDKKRDFISFDNLFINLEGISAFKGGLVLKEIRLERPYIYVNRIDDKSYNFSDLIPEKKAETVPESEPFGFSLNNIQITDGTIEFSDSPKNTYHNIRDLRVMIPFISNLPYYIESFVQPEFHAVINNAPVNFRGMTRPFKDSLETTLNLNVDNLDIPYYLSYMPVKLNMKVDSALLDIVSGITYTQYKNRNPSLIIDGKVILKNISLSELSGEVFFKLPLLGVSINPSDIMSSNINFKKILIQSPELNTVRNEGGQLNLMTIIPRSREQKEKEPEEQTKKGTSFIVNADEILLEKGRISFSDHLPGKKKFSTDISDIDLNIRNFSNAEGKAAYLDLRFRTESGEGLNLSQNFSISPLFADGTLQIESILISKYAPYYEDKINFSINDARLSVKTDFNVEMPEEGGHKISLKDAEAELNGLKLRKTGEKDYFLSIPGLAIKGTEISIPEKNVQIGGISTEKGDIILERMSDGKLNISGLFAESGKEQKSESGDSADSSGSPWIVMLKDFILSGYSISFLDHIPSQPVSLKLSKMKLMAGNISTAENTRGNISFSTVINKEAELSLSGSLGVQPFYADMKSSLKKLDITPFQPYISEKVNLFFSKGSVSEDGRISIKSSEDSGISASFRGDIFLNTFASIDVANSEDLFKWDILSLKGMRIDHNPSSIRIEDILLRNFFTSIILNHDGTLNISNILKKKAAEDEGQAVDRADGKAVTGEKIDKTGQKVAIENITLQDGILRFTDRKITPNYHTEVVDLNGTISGLSSDKEMHADIKLKGKIDNYAPVLISGKINPLSDELFLDMKVDLNDLELSPFTPYSGKYAGYKVQKGKLFLDLAYLIDNKKLDAQNKLFLDQFNFGEKVESPDATKLPVRFAVALLKNRKGEVEIDLPVTGRTDDPQFSIGGLIIKVIVNILVKAATSPFALLGALMGGGDELSFIEFDSGSAQIDATNQEKLSKLVIALSERPALRLEMEGYSDTEADRERLRNIMFEKKLKVQKFKKLVKAGEQGISVDSVVIEKEEYPLYIEMAYKEEKFPKPKNFVGIPKKLPDAEMEKMMRESIDVKDDDLRLLVKQRTAAVKDFIMNSGKVEQERIFMLETAALSPSKKDNVKDSRVDFKLN